MTTDLGIASETTSAGIRSGATDLGSNAVTSWAIRGQEFVGCNCDYGCPCQFGGTPSHVQCKVVIAINIAEGHHGHTRIDNLRIAVIARWPGAIHEGRGEMMPIVDARATTEQRAALLRIMTGLDTAPGATMFQIYSTTFDTVHVAVYAPIEIDLNVLGRRAKLTVPGLIQAEGQPIQNPLTGKEHRARIHLPQTYEYSIAEIGRSDAKITGPVPFFLRDGHARFADIHLTQGGIKR